MWCEGHTQPSTVSNNTFALTISCSLSKLRCSFQRALLLLDYTASESVVQFCWHVHYTTDLLCIPHLAILCLLFIVLGMQRYHFFEYRPIPILAQELFILFFLNQCRVSILLCVKHNLLDNFILMKNNMKIYIGAVYTWSLHAFCNINPIAQNTSGGGLGRIPDELDRCKCIWLLKPHVWILLLPKCKNNKCVRACYRLYDILVRYDCANATHRRRRVAEHLFRKPTCKLPWMKLKLRCRRSTHNHLH